MSGLKLNGHAVIGDAVLKTVQLGQKRIRTAITVPSGSPGYQTARKAVLANDFEITLEGEAHEPFQDVGFDFRAKGQLVNGRVGSDIKANFISTTFVTLPKKAA